MLAPDTMKRPVGRFTPSSARPASLEAHMSELRKCLCGCNRNVTVGVAAAHGARTGREVHDCSRCMMCGNDITTMGPPRSSKSLVIHHIDEDKWNNVMENLMPLHRGCHMRWHGGEGLSEERRSNLRTAAARTGADPDVRVARSTIATARWADHGERDAQSRRLKDAWRRPGRREAASLSQRARFADPAAKAAHSDLMKATHGTAEARALNSARQRRKSPCPDCGVEYTASWMTRHKRNGNCNATEH